MDQDGTQDSVLNELEEWQKRGTELRARLLAEQKVLVERLKEVETALAKIPSEQPQPTPIAVLAADAKQNWTAPDIVRDVLSRQAPLGSGDIIEEAQKLKPGIEPVLVYSAIHRLVHAGHLMPLGKRGRRRYRLRVQDNIGLGDQLRMTIDRAKPAGGHPRKGQIGPTSLMGRAIEILRLAGTPLHAKRIAEQMETKRHKVNFTSLVGGLARLAKEQRVIYRDEQPNTFGLIDWKQQPLNRIE